MISPLLMLVDDEVPFVETMTKRLEKRGVKVICAYGGREALEKLDTNRNVDVVILDVKMPGMDGIATLQEIKQQHPLVEVIMLTGHATFDTAIEGMRLGAHHYLLKPCDMDLLLAMVGEATRKKRGHEEKIREAKVKEALSRHG